MLAVLDFAKISRELDAELALVIGLASAIGNIATKCAGWLEIAATLIDIAVIVEILKVKVSAACVVEAVVV